MFDDDFDYVLDIDGDGDLDFVDREESEEEFLFIEKEEGNSFDSYEDDEEDD